MGIQFTPVERLGGDDGWYFGGCILSGQVDLEPKYHKFKGCEGSPGLFWGGLTGFTSVVSHSGVPTFQIYILPQQLNKLTFAGTATILFAVLNAAKIRPYWELGQFSKREMTITLWLLPAAGVGTGIGKKLIEILPDKIFSRAVEMTLLLFSAKLIADYVNSTVALFFFNL